MTLKQIRDRAIAQSGEPADADASLLNGYVNEGLRLLCAGRLPRTQQVSVENGTLSLETLPKIYAVERLTDASGAEIPFVIHWGTLYAGRDGAYTMTYRGMPDDVSADADEPGVPADYHACLADFATWRILGNGGRTQQARGEHYFTQFHMACSAFEAWMRRGAAPARLKRKYG